MSVSGGSSRTTSVPRVIVPEWQQSKIAHTWAFLAVISAQPIANFVVDEGVGHAIFGVCPRAHIGGEEDLVQAVDFAVGRIEGRPSRARGAGRRAGSRPGLQLGPGQPGGGIHARCSSAVAASLWGAFGFGECHDAFGWELVAFLQETLHQFHVVSRAFELAWDVVVFGHADQDRASFAGGVRAGVGLACSGVLMGTDRDTSNAGALLTELCSSTGGVRLNEWAAAKPRP